MPPVKDRQIVAVPTTCVEEISAELTRNNLDRGGGIRPASLGISGPDRKGLNAGTHVCRNMEVQVEYRIRATASRAFRDRQFCAPAERAQIREGTDVRAGSVGCALHRYDASQGYVLAGTKRSPAPGGYSKRSRGRSRSGTGRNRDLLRSAGGRPPTRCEQSDSGTEQRSPPTFPACHACRKHTPALAVTASSQLATV